MLNLPGPDLELRRPKPQWSKSARCPMQLLRVARSLQLADDPCTEAPAPAVAECRDGRDGPALEPKAGKSSVSPKQDVWQRLLARQLPPNFHRHLLHRSRVH